MREAFERAILEHPDDLSSYSAYADWLQEQDDPRGEFISVQLALEDESRSKEERETLKNRETQLLAKHEREWLGELAPFFREGDVCRYVRWKHGLLSELTLSTLTMNFAQALASEKTARFLHTLRMYGVDYSSESNSHQTPPKVPTPTGQRHHFAHFELLGSPVLGAIRVFYLGDENAEPPEDGWCDCHTYASGVHHVIAEMPNIEELHLLCKDYESSDLFALSNLTKLRVLRMYHLGGFDHQRRYEYALDILAANPAFSNLTHLQFHPHLAEEGYEGTERSYIPLEQVRALVHSKYLKKLTHLQLRLSDMGDDGIREIIASGILKQLKWLDLRHGCVTDEGAQLLAACPDAKRLEQIDLSRNAVTTAGLQVLRDANINAVANNPLTQTELDSREYLREGDFE